MSSGAGALRPNPWTRSRSSAPGVAAAAVRVASTAKVLALGPAQAEDREQERREEDLHADDDQRRREDRHALLGEAAEAAREPLPDHDAAEEHTREREARPEQEPVLEPELLNAALEPGIVVAEVVDRVDAAAEAEADELRADDDEQRAADDRVNLERVAEQRHVRDPGRQRQRAEESDEESRQQEEERRVVHEHQSEVAPAVREGVELGDAAALVQRDRELGYAEARFRRADHHLRRELHAVAP